MSATEKDALTSDQREHINLVQRDVLEAIALRKPLAEVLDLLCRRVESFAPDVVCTVLLVEDGLIHPIAAPSMPPEFSTAIDGEPIGPAAGSCGTAAWRGEPVEVTDIATDPLWERYRQYALPYGLRACWSSPIKTNGDVVATFALYYREPRTASAFHRQMMDACVYLCAIAIQRDETERHIHRLAFYDQLTGLPNRVLLGDHADIAMAEEQPVTIVLIDIDNFKTINDSLGYAVGDHFLRQVAERLRGAVDAKATLCRIGGDEFAALLPGVGRTEATNVAEVLRTALDRRVELDGIGLSARGSMGISVFPDDAHDFDHLLKNAEVAMYQAKSAGRNTFRFYRTEMDVAAMQRIELESALRRAVVEQQFAVMYQPQIVLETGELYGVEALIRWDHPLWGRVSPERFLPLAEECGLINELDAWVLDEALSQLARLDAEGLRVPSISVNTSAKDFQHDKIPRRIGDALRRYRISGQRLIVEITEGVMMHPNESTHLAFQALGALGVRVSVDDFGTGYSSLGYLKRFPVSELKLDRSFVNDLERKESDRALATAVVRVGQSLGLKVIAEGIETPAQLAFLRQQGCDVGQGFFFGKPLELDDLKAWLKSDASLHTSLDPHA